MTTYPARRALSPVSDRQPPQDNHWEMLEAAASSPFEWARRRRAEREARRIEAAGHRALHRLDHLGPAWHVVESPRPELGSGPGSAAPAPREHAGFLAVGPGGVFAITVADHGRARVLIAGDVVQINGRRPPHVADARREAKRASRALSAAIGRTIPVYPVLTFVGTGAISAHGLPRDCLVASYRELDRLLVAGGARISPSTAEKLAEVARDPATWLNGPYRSGGYDWYGAGGTASGTPTGRR